MNKTLIIDMAMPGKTEVDGMMIVVDEKGSITRISAGQESGSLELDFRPAFAVHHRTRCRTSYVRGVGEQMMLTLHKPKSLNMTYSHNRP